LATEESKHEEEYAQVSADIDAKARASKENTEGNADNE
jgi:hypothetical protein